MCIVLDRVVFSISQYSTVCDFTFYTLFILYSTITWGVYSHSLMLSAHWKLWNQFKVKYYHEAKKQLKAHSVWYYSHKLVIPHMSYIIDWFRWYDNGMLSSLVSLWKLNTYFIKNCILFNETLSVCVFHTVNGQTS